MTAAVSVIIPTFNRRAWLEETLESLAQQTYPPDCFEVIVVDDGSSDDTAQIVANSYPFELRYLYQTNQGDAAARNVGAAASNASVLVFLDDDVVVGPDYVGNLLHELDAQPRRIVVGTEHLWLEEGNPLAGENRPGESETADTAELTTIHFADVCSNNMALWREAYFEIGPMESFGFSGSSIWCDVDFTYRAYRLGFDFYRSGAAICWHRDYTKRNLANSKRRMKEVAFRAAALFEKHPDLVAHLPMFDDKTPVAWNRDSPLVILRKLTRRVASTRPVLWVLERLANMVEHSRLARPFQRWIVGGYIFRGYRDGLRQMETVQD